MTTKADANEINTCISSSSEEDLFVLNTEKDLVKYVSSSSEEDIFTPCQYQIKGDKGTVLPAVDPTVIKELEEQAKYTQVNLEKMILFLSNELSSITKVSLESVQTYHNTINNTHIEVENSIRSMYGLIAKCEELDQKMKLLADLAVQVKNIKQTVDVLEQLYK